MSGYQWYSMPDPALAKKTDVECQWPGAAVEPGTSWQAFCDIVRIIFADRSRRWKPMLLSVAVGLAVVSENLILLGFSKLQSDMMTALEQKQIARFYEVIRTCFSVVALALPVIALHVYAKEALDVECRAAVTRKLIHLYLAVGGPQGRGAFYRLHQEGSLDNPDQRILQDVQDYISNGLNLVIDFGSSCLKVMGFAGVLYHISVKACWGIVAYTTFSTFAIAMIFGPSLFQYLQSLTQQEATLRYYLIRVRENAESVALFKGGPTECRQFLEKFAGLVQTSYKKINVITGYAACMWAVKLSTWVVPVMLVGPSYMNGEVEFGAITQASFACNAVFDGMLLLLTRMPDLAGLSVRLARVSAIHSALQREELNAHRSWGGINLVEHDDETSAILEVSAVTLKTPLSLNLRQHAIVDGLTLRVLAKQSLLVAGPSGIGKSAIFRSIAGLWSDGCGTIRRCSDARVFFMPQRPYLCLGTLRDQLLYPETSTSKASATDLAQALSQAGLDYLLERYGLDTPAEEFSNALSLGEQQRLSFARMLLRERVRLVLLDESTSACDVANEAKLYGRLQVHLAEGAYVSIGHRASLRDFHTHELRLKMRAQEIAGSAHLGNSKQQGIGGVSRPTEVVTWDLVTIPEENANLIMQP